MKSIAEQVVFLEERLTEIRSQLLPLDAELTQWRERIDTLSEKVAGTRTGLDEVLASLADTKDAARRITEEQQENRHLRESMTSMFSEAFQVVSRFVETAQKIGILDKEKAESFLADKKHDLENATVTDDIPTEEPAVEPAETVEVVAETEETPPEEPAVETESKDTAAEIAKLSLPPLPDVSASVENLPPVDDTEAQSSAEIASQLDVPPLQLETPEVATDSGAEADEDQIEALLTDLSKPIST